MAVTRMSFAEIKARAHNVDRAKIEGASEADIRRYQVEDGEDPDSPPPAGRLVVPAAAVRAQLGMTQQAFSGLTGIPLGTLRNWEQGRVTPDPAARVLFAILSREPQAAMRALGRRQSNPYQVLGDVAAKPEFQLALKRTGERLKTLTHFAVTGALQLGREMERHLEESAGQSTERKTA
ncbi:helix-turn-helix domain-containing protein [Muricoccus pecuniae]|uniref:DNA-binding transcriptional regulator YiaG n=1 Tax=Muricoccus pecuniae TaxID=693023 RepID=A0A840YHX8_9PROT|nr:helix-turn-helix domain-containing protein [Roseomonas pecuniae]MBB5696041.1 DNA-binding transcriptional regulator YiaG [Roseomonas pecuniae]